MASPEEDRRDNVVNFTGRGRRIIKLTARARESQAHGAEIPGFIPPLPVMHPLLQQTRFRALSPIHEGTQLRRSGRPKRGRLPQTQPTKTIVRAPDGSIIPSFSPNTFMIYDWPPPKPKSFSNLSTGHAAWKKLVDQQERNWQTDDGADDWHDFAGRPENYPYTNEFFDREHCIAQTFVARAKRAFGACQPWEDFEKAEFAIDLKAGAKSETNLTNGHIGKAEGLDNELRIAVFNQLKKRLCNEIWLKEYPSQEPVCPEDVKKGRKKVGFAPIGFSGPDIYPEESLDTEPWERTVRRWHISKTGQPYVLWADQDSGDESEVSF